VAFIGENRDFDSNWQGVRQTLLETFAGTTANPLKHTLYAMVKLCSRNSQTSGKFTFHSPNKHYNWSNFRVPFWKTPRRFFADRRSRIGLIEATLRND